MLNSKIIFAAALCGALLAGCKATAGQTAPPADMSVSAQDKAAGFDQPIPDKIMTADTVDAR